VRAPQRTLLGEDGLALLVTIADQADPFDEAALKLNEESAALASALGRHDVALGRNLLLADRRSDPPGRARALLEAAKSAFALHESDRSRAYVARARELDPGDDLLGLELDVQQAAVDLWTDGDKVAACTCMKRQVVRNGGSRWTSAREACISRRCVSNTRRSSMTILAMESPNGALPPRGLRRARAPDSAARDRAGIATNGTCPGGAGAGGVIAKRRACFPR
jgi:hypothetical protein